MTKNDQKWPKTQKWPKMAKNDPFFDPKNARFFPAAAHLNFAKHVQV
jgi:hypothetical protein